MLAARAVEKPPQQLAEPSREPRISPLSRPEALDVLRYWLSSLQLEEALAGRPRARRSHGQPGTPRLDAPVAGQEYFKVPFDDGLAALVFQGRELQKPFDAEVSGFFETWLAGHYRRGSDRELAHLVTFPVVHLPRGELAGLLRYAVSVTFGEPGGSAFHVPTRAERRRKQYPPPPTEVRVMRQDRAARQWPFFVDTRLLQQQLGVARENIDALFDTLRARDEVNELEMLTLVCELLEAELRGQSDFQPQSGTGLASAGADAAFERLFTAVRALLSRRGDRVRGYPVGIVLDGTRAKTTWYLQRELELLLEEHGDVHWDLESCLGAYLTRTPAAAGAALQRALFRAPDLSESQRQAAEVCWGSTLAAVQGPPGTGKTTLILHLAAEALVRQVEALADRGAMGDGVFVVTSTNNRAVDNVIDPLVAFEPAGLPLALRGGSQRVCEHVLAAQLHRTLLWLEAAQRSTAAARTARLDAALAAFCEARRRLQEQLAPHALGLAERTERAALRRELAALGDPERGRAPSALAPGVSSRVRAAIDALHARLSALSELCDRTPGLAQLKAVDRHFGKTKKRALPDLREALAEAGLEVKLELPPDLPPSSDPEVLMDAWAQAAYTALGVLEAARAELDRAAAYHRRAERRRTAGERLAALGDDAPAPALLPELGALQHVLFETAVEARTAWAARESDALVPVVRSALEAARTDASLRAWFSDDLRQARSLRQLFGTWGCTLLSLGNCFPARRRWIERLVIDEAGQCHPAYAVSGLLRSDSALILGDVHQLEPVFGLERDDDARLTQACKLDRARLEPYRAHTEARVSVQSLADAAVEERVRLIDHFRCQPEIIAISDALCGYGLRVHTPRQGPARPIPFLPYPVSLSHVAGEQQRLGGSWWNAAELERTVELCQALLAVGVDAGDLAVITPYRGQLEQLRKRLTSAGIAIDASSELMELDEPLAASAAGGAALGTVHRFQGGERSIVIFSSVVTRRASLGFLNDRENLLNVAVSRARHRFVALGDASVLEAGARTRLLTRAAEPLPVDALRAYGELRRGFFPSARDDRP